MNLNSFYQGAPGPGSGETSPILIVPYMWIGDFVRSHSVVRLLRARWPGRPVDMLTNTLCAPLLDYMPGLRAGVTWDLPRRRLPFGRYRRLAETLRGRQYGAALVMPRTWKSALAPFLAGIPERVGFVGEARFLLLNDLRWGERKRERMIDRMGALALPKGATPPAEWPLPELAVPPAEIAAWRERCALPEDGRPAVAFAPGAVGPGKAWPPAHYAALARALTAEGIAVRVLGGPNEKALAARIAEAGGALVRDLTGPDLRNAVLALKAADAAVTNDSGLMHIAAALGTATVAVFGPTSPRLWAPLNPLAAALEPDRAGPCPVCGRKNCMNVRHRSTAEIPVARVLASLHAALSRGV